MEARLNYKSLKRTVQWTEGLRRRFRGDHSDGDHPGHQQANNGAKDDGSSASASSSAGTKGVSSTSAGGDPQSASASSSLLPTEPEDTDCRPMQLDAASEASTTKSKSTRSLSSSSSVASPTSTNSSKRTSSSKKTSKNSPKEGPSREGFSVGEFFAVSDNTRSEPVPLLSDESTSAERSAEVDPRYTFTSPLPIRGARNVRCWLEQVANPRTDKNRPPPPEFLDILHNPQRLELEDILFEEYPFLSSEEQDLKVITRIKTAHLTMAEYCDFWAVLSVFLVAARIFLPVMFVLGTLFFGLFFQGGYLGLFLVDWCTATFFSFSGSTANEEQYYAALATTANIYLKQTLGYLSIVNWVFVFFWLWDYDSCSIMEKNRKVEEFEEFLTADELRRGDAMVASAFPRWYPRQHAGHHHHEHQLHGIVATAGSSPDGLVHYSPATDSFDAEIEMFKKHFRPARYRAPWWARLYRTLGGHMGDITTALPFAFLPEFEDCTKENGVCWYSCRTWVKVDDLRFGKSDPEAVSLDWSFPHGGGFPEEAGEAGVGRGEEQSFGGASSSKRERQRRMGLIVMVSGLNGSSNERYCLDIRRQAHRHNYAVVVITHRGYGGAPLRGKHVGIKFLGLLEARICWSGVL